jgi:hypothetical protein
MRQRLPTLPVLPHLMEVGRPPPCPTAGRAPWCPTAPAAAGRWQVTWVELDLRALDRAGALPSADPYLYLPRWQTIGRIAVYADDRLVYRSTGDAVWNGFNFPLWLPLAGDGASSTPPPSFLLLRIESLTSAGGAVSSAWVGPRAALEPRTSGAGCCSRASPRS